MKLLSFIFSSIKNDIQSSVATALLQTFQLTQNDLIALHGPKNKRDLPITNDTFIALDKVQKIHNDCKILMQSGHQTLALDIMEQMTLNQVAFLFIFHHILYNLRITGRCFRKII